MAKVNIFDTLTMFLLSSFWRSNFVLGADSPCRVIYSNSSDSYEVYCNLVPMTDIKKQFNDSEPINIHYLEVTLQSGGDFIPADLLGQSRLTDFLNIIGSSVYPIKPPLAVDPNAFRASRNSTLKYVTITKVQGTLLDFSFLTGFDNIGYLESTYIENLNPTTIPTLPNLSFLTFGYNTGINEAFQVDGDFILETSQGLDNFEAYDCDLDTNGLANLLKWILPSSNETLSFLNIGSNYFSSIPEQMSSFRSIKYFYIDDNRRPLTIGKNTFHCDGCLSIIMASSNITSVESGAFQGNYRSAQVDLSINLLTRFEEGVFKSMLEDMSLINATGFLNVDYNPFDCYSDQCQHLNWLIQDNRHLLSKLKYAECVYDRTPFYFLSQSLCKASGITSTSEKPISNMVLSFLISLSVLILEALL